MNDFAKLTLIEDYEQIEEPQEKGFEEQQRSREEETISLRNKI